MKNYQLLKINKLILRIILSITVCALCIIIVLDVFIFADDGLALRTDLAILGAALATYIVHIVTKKIEWPSFIYFLIVVVTFHLQAYYTDGLFNPYYILGVIILGFVVTLLLDSWMLISMHSVIMISILTITWYHVQFSNQYVALLVDTPIEVSAIYIVVYILITKMTLILKKANQKAYENLYTMSSDLNEKNQEIQKQNQQLQESQKALEESRENLENLIIDRTKELIKSNTTLRQYSQQLEQFAFLTSHHLRVPIARFLAIAELLKETIQEQERTFLFEQSIQQAYELDTLVKEISLILDVKKKMKYL